jgi:uncharacterized protein YcbX
MSSVNEPEGALKLAASMVGDLIRVENQTRTQMQQMADLLGRTVALVELMDETGNEEVVMAAPDGPVSVADHVESLRTTLLSMREMDAALDEQLGGAQMLYDRFLKRYAKEDE